MIRLAEPDQIGAQIKAIRRKQGLTQAELGRRVDLTASSISQVERGRNVPGMGVAGRLAHALGYDLALIPREDT